MFRVFMKIQRGMTDATVVCVYPWEKPILEEIHGGAVQLVTIDEMIPRDGVAKVQEIKLRNEKALPAPPLRERLEIMLKIDPDRDPMRDLDAEYGRLAERYGMHPDIKILMVEKVFGNAINFKNHARSLRTKSWQELYRLLDSAGQEPGESEAEDEKSIAEMDGKELRAFLKERGITAPARAGLGELRELADSAATG